MSIKKKIIIFIFKKSQFNYFNFFLSSENPFPKIKILDIKYFFIKYIEICSI
jgi:hypothetical protein